jgi:hypothetical protein
MAARITINGVERDETPEEEAERLGLSHIPEPSPFKPIEPVPFWNAAYEMLTPPLKKSDIYAAIVDPDERYLAELAIEGRKTYVRDDPFVVDLAARMGWTVQEMDDTWLYVQENYK